jgi:hypothetical protein
MTDDEEDAALFELRPEWRQLRRGRSATRTDRHRFLLSLGLHPLSLILRRSLRLHPEARSAGVDPSCGTCVHLGKLDRVADGEPNPSPLKCWKGAGALGTLRVSRGEATTVRRWWPACVDYEPGDSRRDNFTTKE